MIPIYTDALLAPRTVIVDRQGRIADVMHQLVRTLHQRTGGNSGLPFKVGTGIKAAGATQGTATLLSNDFNSVLSGTGGVILTALQPGQWQIVFNGSGGTLNVYPALAGAIDALGTNNPYSLLNGKSQFYWCESITAGARQFRSLQLG